MTRQKKNVRLENLKRRSEERKAKGGRGGIAESYEKDPGILLLVRTGRLEKLDDTLRRLGHLMGSHIEIDILDEVKGFSLINVKESGWSDNLKRVISFIGRVRALESVMVLDKNAHSGSSLVKDSNRMKVVPRRGVSFEAMRESFLRMTSQFVFSTNMQNTKEGIVIQDLRGIDFFEIISLLGRILDPDKAFETKKIRQKRVSPHQSEYLPCPIAGKCEMGTSVCAA